MTRAKLGTYYLSRIIKGGLLDDNKIVEALQKPVPIGKGKFGWTITKYQECAVQGQEFVFGKLTKYQPEGSINVIDHDKGDEVAQIEPDLVIDSSPFVFIPSHSAFAHLHVWNQIEERAFQSRMPELILAKHQHFFVECSLESIADLRTFFVKIKELDSINEISATIYPPNPLFGPAWKSLKTYLQDRNAEEMKVQEKSAEALSTHLPEIISEVVDSRLDETTVQNAAIGDAAILMATDGYGRGKIVGNRGNTQVTIRTAEATLNFRFEKDPNPEALFEKAITILNNLNKQRKLKHK